jgi:hypothetical protein
MEQIKKKMGPQVKEQEITTARIYQFGDLVDMEAVNNLYMRNYVYNIQDNKLLLGEFICYINSDEAELWEDHLDNFTD